MSNQYRIQVLMSTYNGEKYLKEQLDSIFQQKSVDVHLIIRDDGSSDSTVEIINDYKKKYDIVLYTGENLGAKNGFYKLIELADEDYEYTAFADQDDVWLENKIIRALRKLSEYSFEMPVMYYSNLNVVDKELNFQNKMFKTMKTSSLGEAITYNNVVGCTMAINRKLLLLAKKYKDLPICYHDQWLSILCSAFNGQKIADRNAYILYRQHGNNVVGAKKSIFCKLKENEFMSPSFYRSKLAFFSYNMLKNDIQPQHRNTFKLFFNYKNSFKLKVKLLREKYFLFTSHKIYTVLLIFFNKF